MAPGQIVTFLSFKEEQLSCHSKFANSVPREMISWNKIIFVTQKNRIYSPFSIMSGTAYV
jgi:hypothetical protein